MIQEEKTIVEAVKKVSPSVVSVIISKHLPKTKRITLSPFGSFEIPVPEGKKEATEGELEHLKKQSVQIGGGSGFVVHSDKDYSLILTNKHVVHDREAEYTVLINDKEYGAKVLSSDPLNDIAMLKIKIGGLPVARLGDSSKIQIGQTAVAIGTALGMFTNTVSKGIISGLSRHIAASLGGGEETEVLRGASQTDVAINQGNSGGPLINTEGEVVGINTAIIFGAQNIGFSIPVEWAKRDLTDLHKFGRIIRPYIGLRYIMLNKDIQRRYRLPVDCGALIAQDHIPGSHAVVKNSPADKAGLKENDIILEINGKKLDEKSDLGDSIQLLKAADEIELAYFRKNETHKTKLTLEERK